MKAPTKVIAYKVTEHNLTSWLMNKDSFCVQYEIGKVVKPRLVGTRLFVFKTLEQAKVLADDEYPIFECEVTSPKEVKMVADHHSLADMRALCQQGIYPQNARVSCVMEAAGYSTCLAVTSVKLLKRIN